MLISIKIRKLHIFLFISFYIILMSISSILKHYNLHTFAYDLGIFIQSLSNTLNGKFFYETPDLFWNSSGNFLAVHFSLLIFILLPLYYIFPYAETILIFQSFLLGIAGIPLYLLAYRVTKDSFFSKIIIISYYLSVALHGANLYDFHMEAFLPLLCFSSVYYFEKDDIFKSIFFAILLALTIYTLSILVILLLILYLFNIKTKHYKTIMLIIGTIITVFIYFLCVTFYIIPLIGEAPFRPGSISWFPFLGKSWYEIFYNLIFSPSLVLKSILYDLELKLLYWIILSIPVLFLYIFYPQSFIPMLYWLSISLLTTYKPFYIIGWQYSLIIIPFIYIGSIYGFKNIKKKISLGALSKIRKIILFFSILQMMISPLNPLMYDKIPAAGYDNELLIPPRIIMVQDIFNIIENEAKVLTTNNIFPHLANRPYVYVWCPPNIIPDYIILDIHNIARVYDKIGNVSFIDQVKHILRNEQYGVYAFKGGLLLFKHEYKDKPKILEPYKIRYNYKHIFSNYMNYKIDLSSDSLIVLSGNVESGKIAWFGPYTILVPGAYMLKLKLKVENDYINNTYIEITANKGLKLINKFYLERNFKEENGWLIISFLFNNDEIFFDVEIRAISIKKCTLTLDYIDLIYLNSFKN